MELQKPTIAIEDQSSQSCRVRMDLLPSKQRRQLPEDETRLGFGQIFTDHMFSMMYKEDKGWREPCVHPYRSLVLDPAALVFHYGQEIFEGLKAYRGEDGNVYLFRPRKNIERMNMSAARVGMPPIDEQLFMEGMLELVKADVDWVPHAPGTSLYLRPTCIATQPVIGVRASNEYLFFIIASPSGAYFSGGFMPIRILVEDRMSRAAPGGVGDAKAGGNYAASLVATKSAKEKGYDQVLWLDAAKHELVEEAGTMNVFFVIEGRLVTPSLNGSILAGITRDSAIQIARDAGIPVEERPISIHEVFQAYQDGKLTEAFGTGTAAVITPIGELYYKEQRLIINNGCSGEMARLLHDKIVGIQRGTMPDNKGWRVSVD